MKNSIITEFVNFSALKTTAEENLMSKVNCLNDFQKILDGFIDAELVKNDKENTWCIIYHYDSFEKARNIGKVLRSSKEFEEFLSLVDPKSLDITFNHLVSKC